MICSERRESLSGSEMIKEGKKGVVIATIAMLVLRC
jgi:hypothetical protein